MDGACPPGDADRDADRPDADARSRSPALGLVASALIIPARPARRLPALLIAIALVVVLVVAAAWTFGSGTTITAPARGSGGATILGERADDARSGGTERHRQRRRGRAAVRDADSLRPGTHRSARPRAIVGRLERWPADRVPPSAGPGVQRRHADHGGRRRAELAAGDRPGPSLAARGARSPTFRASLPISRARPPIRHRSG